MSQPVISLRNISKTYRVYSSTRLLSISLIQKLREKNKLQLIHALQNISIDLYPGEILGIIGKNGSGKSTLLKVIAGITRPDSGSIETNGRITSLLELGAGFEPELSGLENIFLYGSLVGISKEQIQKNRARIIEFSGLESFIHQPVKTYSSGMFVRLAFSVAAHSDPDVLLIDEALSVGDYEFQHKCFQFIRKSIKQGVAVIFVSHEMSLISTFCHRVLYLHEGKSIQIGLSDSTIDYYLDCLDEQNMIGEIKTDDDSVSCFGGYFHLKKTRSL